MRFEKLAQIFDLALDMQASHMGLSLEDIKSKLKVEHRTAQRYVRGLEDIFPQIECIISEDRKHRWRLPASTLDKMVTFEADELAAIELSANILHASGQDDEANILRNIERKIQTLMKPNVKRRVEPDLEALLQADGLIVTPGPRRTVPTDHVLALRNAIKSGCIVKVRYTKRDGTERCEKLHPYGFLYGHRHYLVALNPKRKDNVTRKYRLSDIHSVKELDEYFERDENFDLKKFSRQSFGVFNDGMYEVEWLFDKQAAPTASDYIFHPYQSSQLNDDGSLSVTFKASGLQEMAWHLVTWGKHVKIVKPKELIAMVSTRKYEWDVLP